MLNMYELAVNSKSFPSNSSLWRNVFNSWPRKYVFDLLYSKTHLYLKGIFEWNAKLEQSTPPRKSVFAARFFRVQKVSQIFLPLNAASKPDQLKRLVFVVFLLQKLSRTVVWGTLFRGKTPKNRRKMQRQDTISLCHGYYHKIGKHKL